jgi:hypothetical protein
LEDKKLARREAKNARRRAETAELAKFKAKIFKKQRESKLKKCMEELRVKRQERAAFRKLLKQAA